MRGPAPSTNGSRSAPVFSSQGGASTSPLPVGEHLKPPPPLGETERGPGWGYRAFTVPHVSQYVTVSAGLRVVGPKRCPCG